MDQRICRNAHFVTIKVKVDVHVRSLHEASMDVNLRIKNLRQSNLTQAELFLVLFFSMAMDSSRWD